MPATQNTNAFRPSSRWGHSRFRHAVPARPRSPWGRFQPPCAPALRPKPRLDAAVLGQADWPGFWAEGSWQLRAVGLRTGTLRVYRHVLRSFRAFLIARGAGNRPGCATPALARAFLYRLADRPASGSWTATHITVLRTFFDKLGGAHLTVGIPTPKRPRRIHDVLDAEEVGRLLKAAGSTRDRLAILLLFGCGLRASELCSLRWSDVDLTGRTLRVKFAGGTRERTVPLPANALMLLQAESCFRHAGDAVFPGMSRRSPAKPDLSGRSSAKSDVRGDQPMSVRTAERIVRRAAARAGMTKEVCCRTLRRSYVVQGLREGMHVITLCNNLGHQHVESTLAYTRYLPPRATDGLGADFSAFRLPPVAPNPPAPAQSSAQPGAP